ncbi:MAG TPA: DinB family protein [Isosphaeraceae bacterium]|nr:DinB family protein [Isosphaeraceae bacterium]
MINDDIVSLYAFNRWADRKVLQACRSLSQEQYLAEPVPGWSSVSSTILHITMVTDAWLRGLTGEVIERFLTEAEVATIDDADRCLDAAYETLDRLPIGSPEWLNTPMTLRGRGRSLVLPPWAILRHVVNHSSYHRGQVASKLKRFGIEQPATDLLFWAIEQSAPQG